MPPRLARLAGFGALGAVVGMLALYALVVLSTLPRGGSGIDRTQAIVTWISVGLVIFALIGAHILLARQLLALGRGDGRRR